MAGSAKSGLCWDRRPQSSSLHCHSSLSQQRKISLPWMLFISLFSQHRESLCSSWWCGMDRNPWRSSPSFLPWALLTSQPGLFPFAPQVWSPWSTPVTSIPPCLCPFSSLLLKCPFPCLRAVESFSSFMALFKGHLLHKRGWWVPLSLCPNFDHAAQDPQSHYILVYTSVSLQALWACLPRSLRWIINGPVICLSPCVSSVSAGIISILLATVIPSAWHRHRSFSINPCWMMSDNTAKKHMSLSVPRWLFKHVSYYHLNEATGHCHLVETDCSCQK